jgi:hypothetical protein
MTTPLFYYITHQWGMDISYIAVDIHFRLDHPSAWFPAKINRIFYVNFMSNVMTVLFGNLKNNKPECQVVSIFINSLQIDKKSRRKIPLLEFYTPSW